MKLVELENVSEKRISIMQVSLRMNPGQKKRVHPTIAEHPSVVPYVGNGLKVNTDEDTVETRVEPIAPVASIEPVKPILDILDVPAETPETPEIVVAPEEPKEEAVQVEKETDGTSLRIAFVEAPGVTDANVDDIMGVFSSFAELADASKDDLVELGVAKSYAKKLLEFAANQ